MADIQKCTGTVTGLMCKLRDTCYRYTAVSSGIQAYGSPAPDFHFEEGCQNYWDNGQTGEKRK